jgi:hypothetical protein
MERLRTIEFRDMFLTLDHAGACWIPGSGGVRRHSQLFFRRSQPAGTQRSPANSQVRGRRGSGLRKDVTTHVPEMPVFRKFQVSTSCFIRLP